MRVTSNPFPNDPHSLPAYIDRNFTSLIDEINDSEDTESGTVLVVGTVNIATKFKLVDNAFACLNGVPVAGACFVRAYPHPTLSDNIVVEVYTNGFVLSSTGIVIQWMAIGQVA